LKAVAAQQPASGNAAKGGGGSSPGMFIPQDRAHPCPRAGRGGAMPHYRIEFIPARERAGWRCCHGSGRAPVRRTSARRWNARERCTRDGKAPRRAAASSTLGDSASVDAPERPCAPQQTAWAGLGYEAGQVSTLPYRHPCRGSPCRWFPTLEYRKRPASCSNSMGPTLWPR